MSVKPRIILVNKISTISLRIPTELLMEVDLLAKKLGMSRSELIRVAIKHYISIYKQKA